MTRDVLRLAGYSARSMWGFEHGELRAVLWRDDRLDAVTIVVPVTEDSLPYRLELCRRIASKTGRPVDEVAAAMVPLAVPVGPADGGGAPE